MIFTVVAAFFVRLVSLGLYPLTDPTEGRYADIGRRIVESGDWVTPWLDKGVPFWGKPPLSIWMTGASLQWLGESAFAARLPHFLAGALILWIVYDLFKRANLAKAMMGINATKGFEIGSGFEGVKQIGSSQNDSFVKHDDGIRTKTNNSGGIQGGISNGEEIVFRVAFKAPASISKTQNSVDKLGNNIQLSVKGRHDPCVVPRAVPVVEAMAALVIADHLLITNIYNSFR